MSRRGGRRGGSGLDNREECTQSREYSVLDESVHIEIVVVYSSYQRGILKLTKR